MPGQNLLQQLKARWTVYSPASLAGNETLHSYDRSNSSVALPWLIAPLALTVALYAPVLWHWYGVSEDYRLMAFYQRGGVVPSQMLVEGRPFYALWSYAVFRGVTEVGDLAAVRALNVVVIGVLATFCATAWRHVGFSAAEAAAAALLTISQPSFQLFASCAFMGGVPIAALFAASSAFVGYRAAGVLTFRRRWLLRVAAFALLLVSLLMYQPAAMFYWVIVAILLLGGNPNVRDRRPLIRNLVGIGLASLPVGFLVHRIAVSTYTASTQSAQRAVLTTDIPAKAAWFVSFPLKDSLNFWSVAPSAFLALAVGTATACGLLLYVQQSKVAIWPRVVLALVLISLSYLPNLVVAESWSSYRSQIALSALLVSYAVLVIRAPFLAPRSQLRRGLMLTTCGMAFWLAVHNVTDLVIVPQAQELRIVRREVSAWPDSARVIAVQPADASDALVSGVRYDEFGRPSTSHEWSAVDLPYLLLNKSRSSRGLPSPELYLAREPPTNPQVRVDWGEVLRASRLQPRTHE